MKNYFKQYVICLILCICLAFAVLVLLNKCSVLQEQYFKESRTDYLTGISNRRSFCTDIRVLLKQPEETIIPLTAIFLDVDKFKKINDTFGHATGDLVLKILARIIEKNIHPFDLAARFGGDEFGIIMPHTNEADALSIMKTIAEEFSVDTKKIVTYPVSFCIGTTTFTAVPTIEKIFHEADFQLRVTKQCL